MTNEELRALNKNREIQQIAWLTRDLEKSMQAWIDVLRVGPWRVFSFTDKTVKNLKVGGRLVEEPFEFRIGISSVGNMEIELIQPVRGPMIYEEYIQRRGEGLHHIKEKLAGRSVGQGGEGLRVARRRGHANRSILRRFPFLSEHRAEARFCFGAWQLPLPRAAAGVRLHLSSRERLNEAPRDRSATPPAARAPGDPGA